MRQKTYSMFYLSSIQPLLIADLNYHTMKKHPRMIAEASRKD